MFLDAGAVGRKLRIEEAAHVFDHDRARSNHADELNHRGEKIAFIVSPELLSGIRKGRAGDASRNQINTAVFVCVFLDPGDDVPLDDIPVGPIFAKGLTGVMIDFDDSEVLETCLFEAEGLTTCTGTDLNRCQSHVPPSATVSTG